MWSVGYVLASVLVVPGDGWVGFGVSNPPFFSFCMYACITTRRNEKFLYEIWTCTCYVYMCSVRPSVRSFFKTRIDVNTRSFQSHFYLVLIFDFFFLFFSFSFFFVPFFFSFLLFFFPERFVWWKADRIRSDQITSEPNQIESDERRSGGRARARARTRTRTRLYPFFTLG